MVHAERFLIVDDDDLMLDTLQNCIGEEGFGVEVASSGAQAVEMARDQEFDVIISDVMMPGMNGIETIQAVKVFHPSIHSIVITGYASAETPIKAIKVGVDDYIHKPFELDEFAHTIHRNVENLRLRRHLVSRQREMEAAKAVQELLLPKTLPRTDDLAASARYAYSMGLGGDYYDIFPLGEGRWAILMGDVSGHDIASALVMVMVRTLAHQLIKGAADPSFVLETLTQMLCRDISQALYVCLFLGILDLPKGELIWSNSGSPPGYIVRSNGALEILSLASLPVGIFEEGQYENRRSHLDPGDTLWLYTDGVLDTVDDKNRYFGEERLEAFLAQTAGVDIARSVEALSRELENFRKKSPLMDDYTYLGVQLLKR